MSVRMSVMMAGLLAIASATFAQDRAVLYEFGDRSDVRIVTDVVFAEAGGRFLRHELAPGSRSADARAIDRATGQPLSARIQGAHLIVDLGRSLPPRAEQRVGIEEVAARGAYLKGEGQGAKLVFAQRVQGRVTLLLPPGYTVRACSVPAQYAIENGRMKVGIVAVGGATPVTLETEPGASAPATTFAGSFRALDERNIIYWLDEPETQRIRLALELLLTKPGQSHVYSVLIKSDNITNPETLDVDRGAVLPTRIMAGSEATAIGDSPSPIPADASVLVADLGYAVPKGGSARIRLYQVATDAQGYKLGPDGELSWTRFLARLRTRVVLPPGWALTAVDQPAIVGRDEQERVTLDFVNAGADSPILFLTARKRR